MKLTDPKASEIVVKDIWIIYPHTSGDGKALHIVDVFSVDEIRDHLRHLAGLYEHGDPVGIVERR